MERKKIVPIGLVVATTALLMTGCAKKPVTGIRQDDTNTGKNTEAELSGKLVVWAGDLYMDVFKKIADDFTKETGVAVELVSYTGIDATDKLALDGPSGKGGDVYVQGGGSALERAVDQSLFKSLDDAGIDEELFAESTIEDYRYQGYLYGIPLGAETPALIYNKALIPEIPDTWDELMEECDKIRDLKKDQHGFLMDVTNPYFSNAFFDANGGYIFKKTADGYDVQDIGLNNKGTKEMVTQLNSYYEDGRWQKNMTFDVMEKKFTDGKAAVIYDGPWAVAGFKNAGIDIGIASIPKLANGKAPKTFSGGFGLAISEYAQNEDAAVAFLKHAMKEENIMAYCDATNRIPSLKSCLELDEIKNDPIKSAFAKQLENSMPQPNVPEMSVVYTPMIDALTLITTQGEDIDVSLDKAVEQIKEQIAVMKK